MGGRITMKKNRLIQLLVREYLEDDTASHIGYLKCRLAELDDLTARLQRQYKNGGEFKQEEPDRLCTYDLCELLKFLIGECK